VKAKIYTYLVGQTTPLKPLNALQRRNVYDHLPRAHGEILYSDLQKDRDTQAVRCELSARNLPCDSPEWAKVLLVALKEHEQNTKYFKPICPEAFAHLIGPDNRLDVQMG